MLEILNIVLEIHNTKINIKPGDMKKKNKTYMMTSIIVMFALLGFAIAYTNGFNYGGLDILIFALIIVIGSIALFLAHKKDKADEGFPEEDELSMLLKYKAGYYAFRASMFIWFFIFIFKEYFPDVETMLGGGILLSALSSFIIMFVLKRGLNE